MGEGDGVWSGEPSDDGHGDASGDGTAVSASETSSFVRHASGFWQPRLPERCLAERNLAEPRSLAPNCEFSSCAAKLNKNGELEPQSFVACVTSG